MPGMKAIRNGELFAFVPVTRGEVEFRPAGCTLYLLLPTPGTKGPRLRIPFLSQAIGR